MDEVKKCELCGSDDSIINFHHLIPKTLHRSKKFIKMYSRDHMNTSGLWLCKWHCHRQIHRFISEKDMGMSYYTKELLLEHKEVKKYIEWRKKRN